MNLPEEVSVVDKDILSCTPEDLEGYEQVIFLAGLSNNPMAEFDPAMNFVRTPPCPPTSPTWRSWPEYAG